MTGGQKLQEDARRDRKEVTGSEDEEDEDSGDDEEQTLQIKSTCNLDLWDNDDKESVANSQAPMLQTKGCRDLVRPDGGTSEEDEESWSPPVKPSTSRGTWSGQFDFLLSLLGYSVGLGNVWRFPYLCYSNGGGAFLLPFCAMLLLAGLPLLFLELALGQFVSLGPTALFSALCPLWAGLGAGMVVVSAVVMLYYNLVIAWTLYYLVASAAVELPWAECRAPWASPNCFVSSRNHCSVQFSPSWCIQLDNPISPRKPPAQDYFENHVLGMSSGIEDTGSIRWPLALSLASAWAIVFVCLSRGVQSSGKVVYFTALFPYAVLVALFIRGITLPGAADGMIFYLSPDWTRLGTAQVWGDAAVQVFFALSPAWGGLITLASYNKFHNNCYRDALIVSVSNVLTSFFAGLVIFAAIGFLAHELQVGVATVVDQGAGLAFIVIPEVVARLLAAPVWSLLFFLMLLTLGLDSQFALMETVTTAIFDRFPALRKHTTLVVFAVSVLGYLGGLIFTTSSGMYWLQLADKYAANWSVLLIAIAECLLISWSYGTDRFLNNVEEMLGPKSLLFRAFWGFMWRYATPATLTFILVFNWVEYAPARIGRYTYPFWADVVGWILAALPVVIILGFASYRLQHEKGTMLKRVRHLMQPTSNWGPEAGRKPPPPPSSASSPTLDSLQRLIRGGAYINGIEVVVETRINAVPRSNIVTRAIKAATRKRETDI